MSGSKTLEAATVPSSSWNILADDVDWFTDTNKNESNYFDEIPGERMALAISPLANAIFPSGKSELRILPGAICAQRKWSEVADSAEIFRKT